MKIEPPNMLEEALKRFPPSERQAWVREVKRLTYIILTYASIVKKRQLNRETGKYEFVSDVLLLCQQAKCNDPILISREPHRAFLHQTPLIDGIETISAVVQQFFFATPQKFLLIKLTADMQ